MPIKSIAFLRHFIIAKLHLEFKYCFNRGGISVIDYKDIGTRIRAIRMERSMTQAQLAEACGVGVTHISHVETGNGIPSLETFLSVVNALECSADELLCIEVDKARPIYETWLNEQLVDCSRQEMKLISDVVVGLKTSLRRLEFSEQQ